MALDVSSLLLSGLAWLLWKGAGTPKAPAKVPWPGTPKAAPAASPAAAAARVYRAPGASPVIHEASAPEPGSGVPLMQKGIPGVKTFAQAAIEQLKREQAAKEFGSGSGTGTRHYVPSRHVTAQQRERAVELSRDPNWKAGQRFRDRDDPSVLYVSRWHGKKHGVEVWTSDY